MCVCTHIFMYRYVYTRPHTNLHVNSVHAYVACTENDSLFVHANVSKLLKHKLHDFFLLSLNFVLTLRYILSLPRMESRGRYVGGRVQPGK